MDLEYNAKLEAIMKKHNTDIWNDDCRNDPDYKAAQIEKFGASFDDSDLAERVRKMYQPRYMTPSEYSNTKRDGKKLGAVKVGSYKFKSKKK